jgi:hypothetical protein
LSLYGHVVPISQLASLAPTGAGTESVASKKQAVPKTAQTSRTERRGLQGMRDSIHRSSAV